MQLPKGIKPHTRKYADGERRQTTDKLGRPYFYFRIRTTDPTTGEKENVFRRSVDVEALVEEYNMIKAVGWGLKEMTRNTLGLTYPDVAVKHYLSHCKNTMKLTTHTLRIKERILLEGFATYFMTGHVRLLKSIDVQDISEWLEKAGEDASPSTWIRNHKEINAFYNWALEHYHKEIKFNPVKAINTRNKAHDVVRRKPPQDHEMDALVQTLANGSGERIGEFTQHEAMIWFAILSWCRRKELMDLEWKHVDWNEGTYSLPARKGGKVVRDTIIMNDAERKILQWAWDNRVNESKYVFHCQKTGNHLKQSAADLVQKYFKKAGVTKTVLKKRKTVLGFHQLASGGHAEDWATETFEVEVGKYGWHSLRHRGISKAANDGKTPIYAVMKRARHSKITTTQGYIHDDGQKNEIGGDFDDY